MTDPAIGFVLDRDPGPLLEAMARFSAALYARPLWQTEELHEALTRGCGLRLLASQPTRASLAASLAEEADQCRIEGALEAAMILLVVARAILGTK